MRIGNSYSKSYRLTKQRQRIRNVKAIERLCIRLDKLVARAESFGPLTATRKLFMDRADKVREALRAADH